MKQLLLTTSCVLAFALTSGAYAQTGATPVPAVPVKPTIQMDGPTGITTLAKNYSIKDGVVVNSAGQFVARYDATSNQYIGAGGKPIAAPVEQALFKQVYSNDKYATKAKEYTVKDGGLYNNGGIYMGKFNAKGEFIGAGGQAVTAVEELAIFTKAYENAAKPPAAPTPTAGSTSPIKNIGEGYVVNAAGDILQASTGVKVAKVDPVGNIIAATDKKLEAGLRTQLNKLMKGVSLPIGFGADDRMDSRVTQKNTYVAATDDGSTYYGNSAGGAGGIDTSKLLSGVIKAAEDKDKKPTTPATGAAAAAANYTMVSDGFIRGADGTIIGRYIAASNQIVDANGTVLNGGDKYEVLKAVVARAQATGAAGTPTATSPTGATSVPPALYGASKGWNSTVAQSEWNSLSEAEKKDYYVNAATANGGFKLQGANTIMGPDGKIAATITPAGFTYANGTPVKVTDPIYSVLKAAAATRN